LDEKADGSLGFEMDGSVISKYQKPNPEIVGFIWDGELDWLYEKATQMDSVIEIGSWIGRSTHALLSGCKGTVYAVDHFNGSDSVFLKLSSVAEKVDIQALFLKNVGHFPNLQLKKMDSIEASKLFEPKSIDMVFIDGDHNYDQVKADIEAWKPVCKKLLCGHDLWEGGVFEALQNLRIPYFALRNASIWYSEIKE
jgi:hypothetical protein